MYVHDRYNTRIENCTRNKFECCIIFGFKLMSSLQWNITA